MKSIILAAVISAFALGSFDSSASASPVVSRPFAPHGAIENVYYYHGHYYPYRHNGHYYRYRSHGHYYNHRHYSNGHWRYY